MVIRKIEVASAAKVFATMYALWGAVFGVFFALIALAGAGIGAAADEPEMAWLGPMFGVGAIVLMPILYGVLGAIFGALTAVIYNLIAGTVGGLSVEVE
jgi:uncharacterized membrane protein